MTIRLTDSTPEGVLYLMEEVLADPDQFNPEFDSIELGPTAALKVYLPEPDRHSSITPPYMEAFIELQTQIFQLAALAKTGVANAGLLTEREREELQINVIVTNGSSNYITELAGPLERLLKKMVGKMTGRQAVIVLLGIVALIASPMAFSSWLENRRLMQIEELRSKEHIAALQALSYANEQSNDTFRAVLNLLELQGNAGKRAINLIDRTNEALLRAAEHSSTTTINEVQVTGSEATLLRAPTRRRAETRIEVRQVQVVDINVSDPLALIVVVSDSSTQAEYRFKFVDTLFSEPDRHRLFHSLEFRQPIWAELAIRHVEEQIRSVQLLRVREPLELPSGDDED